MIRYISYIEFRYLRYILNKIYIVRVLNEKCKYKRFSNNNLEFSLYMTLVG